MRPPADGEPPTIVFDTDCVLCSRVVAFILAHERGPRLRFVGAWSKTGLALAAKHGFARADLDETFLVIADGIARTRSDAGLALLRELRAPWRWLVLLRLVPRGWRDAAYAVVARNRHRWFGRAANCTRIPPDQRDRFLDLERTV